MKTTVNYKNWFKVRTYALDEYLILSVWFIHFLYSLASQYRIFHRKGVELPAGELKVSF